MPSNQKMDWRTLRTALANTWASIQIRRIKYSNSGTIWLKWPSNWNKTISSSHRQDWISWEMAAHDKMCDWVKPAWPIWLETMMSLSRCRASIVVKRWKNNSAKVAKISCSTSRVIMMLIWRFKNEDKFKFIIHPQIKWTKELKMELMMIKMPAKTK